MKNRNYFFTLKIAFGIILIMIGNLLFAQNMNPVSISISSNPVRTGQKVTLTASGLSVLPPGALKWYVNGVCMSGGDIDSGMVAFYPFNSNANDSSGNGNHAADVTASLTTDRFGHPDAAYNFGGVNNPQFIRIPNSPSLQFNDQATFSLWVKMNSYFGQNGLGWWIDQGYHILFAKDVSGYLKQGIQGLATGQFVADIESNGSTSGISVSDTADGSAVGKWMNLTWVYTPTQAKMYVDGQLQKTADGITSFASSNSKDLYLGRVNHWREYWLNGKLDDIRFYNRSLTDAEVRRISDNFDSVFHYIPQNNDTIYCVYQPFGSATADTSNIIVMSVLPVPVYVVFVTPEGAGLMDGSSWSNAIAGNSPAGNGYTKLADTLRHASAGAHFWIKEGTYFPSTDNDRSKSFQVPEGVMVYGGFGGNESSEEERNSNDHFSVLSGDIGVPGSSSDNTFHVVTTIGNASEQYILLDGMTIRDGNTVSAPYSYGAGVLTGYKTRLFNCQVTNNNCEQSGGGVFATGTTEIVGCTFTHNNAFQGAAIFVYGTANVTRCKISQNSAWAYGGGIGNEGSCNISNCLIVNNNASNGGGVLIRGGTTIANSTIANNLNDNIVFWLNSTGTIKNSIVSGGGISVWTGASMDCQYSCTDDSIPGEGNIRQNPMFVAPTLINGTEGNGLLADWHMRWCSPCLNTGNNAMIPNGITTDINGDPRILYTTVDPGAYESDSSTSVHNVVGFNNNRIYISNNTQYTGSGSSWETALAGNGESCKYQGQSLLYEAMKDAQSGTEIWIEKGTYKTSLYLDRNHSFTVGQGVKVFGGFQGDETSLDQRNPATYKTILSGNIGDTTTDADNAFHILNINPSEGLYADSALVDGVVLERARTEGTDASTVLIHSGSMIRMSRVMATGDTLLNAGTGFIIKSGAKVALTDGTIERFPYGGIYNEGNLHLSNFTVKSNHFTGIQNFDSLAMYNCTIDSNLTLGHHYQATGGAIQNGGYCTINGGNIRGNKSYVDAAGILNKPNAMMKIIGCNISGNKCNTYGYASGGGILNSGMLEIKQSTINNNAADAAGGGIYNSEGATCTISGSTIAYNQVKWAWLPAGGGGVYNGGICHLERTIVSNNETTGRGGGIYNPTSLRNCIIVNNKRGDGYGLTGGGIYLAAACEGFFNSTIMNNTGEGIASELADTIEIGNSIIFGNELSLSGHFNSSYSCIAGTVPTNHNTMRNPHCISPSEGKGPGFDGMMANWGLWGCSPCVNTGNNALLQAGDTLDAAAAPRVKWNKVDIGAMELQTDSVSGDCPPGISHNIVWEIFRPKVDDVQTTTGAPDESVYLTTLETEFSDDLNTLSRLRGHLIPPVTGYYRFYFSADPYATLFLSTDSSDMNIRQIGSTDHYGNYLWPASPVVSDSVYLELGKAYYFESFCKGYFWNNCCNPWIKTNIKGNYLKIGWVLPGTSNLSVIPWNNVRPAGPRTLHGLQWEIFENKTSYDFVDLKNSATIPDEVVRLDSLSTKNYATTKDHFSSRIRGYLVAPATGEYTFYFACDNVGQFWLSSDTMPENAQLKNEITYCQPDWTQNTCVQTLVAGQRYFFEILHYDTVYTDLIKVGWKIPGDTLPQVIRYPFVVNYDGIATVQSFSLLEHEATAFPGWNVTPRYHLAAWNARNKSISWTSSNPSVATVNADGIINMVSPGVCHIIARPVGNPALSDSLRVTVTNYYGPYFVKQNAAENGDGHSWDNAISLTKILSILNQGELSQQVKVYVAEGIHKPTATIDQNQSFNLNHTRIVGGFPNSITGNDTTTRDYANHETILSGEIGSPVETIDNCYHVVVAQNNCTIDGFTIRDGRASCSSYGWTPGFSYYKREDNGGGIIVEGGILTIKNCKLTNNSAWNSGGGLFCRGAIVQIMNCEIYSNSAISETIGVGGWFVLIINTHGAGISASSYSVLNITDCQIYNNSAMGTASAIFQQGSVINLQNSTISNNYGGGNNSLYNTSGSTMTMNNVTIKGDVVYFSYPSGNIRNTTIDGKLDVGYCYSKDAISLDNCIITGFYPTAIPSSSSYYNLADSVFAAKYCILGNSLFGSSKDVLISDSIPDYTSWLDTLANNGGLTPTMKLKNIPNNPAKSNGNPFYLGTTDQRGAIRIDSVSIGAYQYDRPYSGIIEAKVFPEGLLDASTGILNKSYNEYGEQFVGNIADKLTFELLESTAPYNLIGSALQANLLTSGYAYCYATVPLPDSVYIVVKHRNSIETWSSIPVSPVNGLVQYDFTQQIASAYGNNLKPIGSYFCIYSGDVNQDGVVDALDMIIIDNQAAAFGLGYIPEDLNGDGSVDALDMILIDNNAAAFIGVIEP